MTIQREYSLPNCRLVLDGVGEDTAQSNAPGGLPLMSMLVNVECYLPGLEQPIGGGSDFFASLVAAVSKYAQSVLSGVRSPEDSTKPAWVRLEKGEKNTHRLIVQDLEEKNGKPEPIQIDLTTPQLFDLVEAVDQFFADKRTLPKLGLELTPVAKKYARTHQGSTKRAIPLALGVSSLAVAAIALFFLPVPEVKRPTEPLPGKSSQEESTSNPTEGSASGSDNPGGSAAPEGAASLESALSSIPEISDPNQLERLQERLYRQLDEAWGADRTNEEDLAYQVAVSTDGDVLGFKPENEAARYYPDSTPLSKLLYVPPDGGTAASESLARFRVVFRENGALEVSPWEGGDTAAERAPAITEPAVVEDLLFKLREKINDAWTQEITFDRQLIYRVSVTREGAIADYESINQTASDYLDETPLRSLHQPSAAVSGSNGKTVREPVAQYQVVFKPQGFIEVSPWDGF